MKETFGDHLVQTPPQGRDNFQVRLGCLKALSRQVLKTSMDGGPSLSNLSQCLTSLPVKSCFLSCNGSFLHCHLWPLSPALLLFTSQESLPLSPLLLLQPAPCSAFSLISWQNWPSGTSAVSHSTLHCLDLLLVLEAADWAQLSRCSGRESPAPTHQLCLATVKLFLLQGRTAASPAVQCPPDPQVLFQWMAGSQAVVLLGNAKPGAGLLLSCLWEQYLYRVLRLIVLS